MPIRRLIFAALLCLLSAGCLKPPPPAGITQLQFYYMGWLDDRVYAMRMIDAFERENPDIKVNLTLINPSTDYSQRMQTLMVGGVVPDVMSTDPNVYYEWADRGMLMDVTDIMEGAAREQKMTFMPIVPDELLYRGRYYVVPYSMCGVILQLNLDIFQAGGHRDSAAGGTSPGTGSPRWRPGSRAAPAIRIRRRNFFSRCPT